MTAATFSAVQLFFLLSLLILAFGSYIIVFYFVVGLSTAILDLFVQLKIVDEFDFYYSPLALTLQLFLITVVAAVIMPGWTCCLYWLADAFGLLEYFGLS